MTSFPGESALGSAFRRSPTLNRDSDRSVGRNLAGHVLGPGTNNFGETIDSAARSSIGVVTIKPGNASSAPQSTTGDVEEPLLRASEDDAASALQRRLEFAYNVSWVVNILLFASKFYAWWISGSKAVLASLADSFVDLVSQVVIFVAEWQSKRMDPRFPVGQARLETLGVLLCALIMALASVQVIEEAGNDLYNGFVNQDIPRIDASLIMYLVLGSATVLKALCYILCSALSSKSDSMVALAEDHLNDIMSNIGAAITAALAVQINGAWWADGGGAILISLVILWRWFDIAKGQVEKIVGSGAPADFVEQLSKIGEMHHDEVTVDCIRAYHFGSRYMVEMEIIMPIEYTLKQVHDISLELQIKLEALADVERAFVHVDYEKRDQPEHRTERLLQGLPVLREGSLESSAENPSPKGAS